MRFADVVLERQLSKKLFFQNHQKRRNRVKEDIEKLVRVSDGPIIIKSQ